MPSDTRSDGRSFQAVDEQAAARRLVQRDPERSARPVRASAGSAPYPPRVTDVGAAAGATSARDPGRDLFLAGIERTVQPLDDPAEIMSTVARLVGERLACDRCAYAEAEADEDHFTMTGSYSRGLPPLHGRMAMSDFSAETLRCMRAGEPYVVADAFADERVLPEQRDIYRRTGITAVVCVPLHKGGRFVAAMAVHQATPRAWAGAEIELLTTVVARCWESLQRVHARWRRCATTRSATGCSPAARRSCWRASARPTTGCGCCRTPPPRCRRPRRPRRSAPS